MTPTHPDAPAAFRAAYAAHRDAVWRFALRRTGDHDAAEDVTTEVFVVAWRRWREVPDAPLPWLYGVARKVLANQRRADARRAALHERAAVHTPASAGDHADAVGERHVLAAALARLGEGDREVLRLLAWEGLDVHEIAVVLGCRRGTAAVRLHRARKRLRAALDEEEHAAAGPAPVAVFDLTSDPLPTPSSTP